MKGSSAPDRQGALDYVLLVALLALVAGGIVIVAGPGVGAVYSDIAAWFSTLGTPGSSASPSAPPAGAPCADILIRGSASFRDANHDGQVESIHFGGDVNCSLVSGTSAAGDPLDASARIGRLRCVAIDPITLDPNPTAGPTGDLTFRSASASSSLRILEARHGALLLSANLTWGDLVISPRGGALTITDVTGLQADDRIGSPTLATFSGAPAVAGSLTFPAPGSAVESAGAGSLRLTAHSIPFTARISTICRR